MTSRNLLSIKLPLYFSKLESSYNKLELSFRIMEFDSKITKLYLILYVMSKEKNYYFGYGCNFSPQSNVLLMNIAKNKRTYNKTK